MASQSEGNIITSPQTVTGAWVDMGDEIESIDYSFFSAYLVIDINDSRNVQFRFRGIYGSGENEYIIPLQTVKSNKVLVDDFYYEIDDDSDQNIILQTEIDQNIKIVKLQVKAMTVGATAAIITTARYRQGYRQ